MSRLIWDETAGPVSRDQTFRRERGQFPSSADYDQDTDTVQYACSYLPKRITNTLPGSTVSIECGFVSSMLDFVYDDWSGVLHIWVMILANIWYEGTHVFDFKWAVKEGKGGEKRGKGKGGRRKERGEAGLHFSLVRTLYSSKSAKLKHSGKPSVYTCILLRCCCVEILYYVDI